MELQAIIASLLTVATTGYALDTNLIYMPTSSTTNFVPGTNAIYVPLEPGVPLSDAVRRRAYEAQLELAKNLPESRPAELDPEGNWGPLASGLQLGIRLSTNTFVSGQPIRATVILRNTSTNSIVLPTFGPWSIDLNALDGGHQALKAANRSKWYTYSGTANLPLTPKRQLSYVFDLNDIFDLRTPGKYYLSAKRLKEWWGVLPEVQSGTAQISVVEPAKQKGVKP